MGVENLPKNSYVIIGGVAAGATAAARLRRLDEAANITVLEKGPYVSFANCGLPYLISGDIRKRSSLLLQTPEGFYSRYRVDVKVNTEAVEIDRERKTVVAMTAQGRREYPYDALLLAQGGSPIRPDIPGSGADHVFTLWTIPDMDRIQKFIDQRNPRSAVIAGGGFVGLEMAEAFTSRGMRVTVVELAQQVMIQMDPEFGAMISSTLGDKGITVNTGTAISRIQGSSVTLDDGTMVEADLVLFSAGVRPELTLVRAAGLETGPSGGVVVDETMRTNDPDIFAAGDMVEVVHRVHGKKVRVPLAGPANRQGRIAATNMLGGSLRYRGALGTSVVKLFGHTAASTGLSEKASRDAGFETGVAYVFRDNHVGYYPGGKQLALKIVYDRHDARLLGAQAYGESGVEKRIDVIATALHGNMTLDDLAEIDLAYAPPYNGANDPINVAAFAGLNNINGMSPLKSASEALDGLREGNGIVLDVRTVGEQAKAPLPDALHIPADEIRDRLDEIPKEFPIFILSKDGYLGHTTLQILKANGWKRLYNITGGYLAARWTSGWKFTAQD